MEKIYSSKSKNRRKSDDQDPECSTYLQHDQIAADIDRLTDELSTVEEKSISPELPDTLDTFLKVIESKIKIYNSLKPGMRFSKMAEEDEFFVEISSLWKLKIVLHEFPNTTSFNNIYKVALQSIELMENEFEALLHDSNAPSEPITKKGGSDPNNEVEFPGYTEENVSLMNKIVTVMITAGFEFECCQMYNNIRKEELMEQFNRYEFEKLNVEDVHKSKWISLEHDIIRWVNLTNHCSDVLFPAEKTLREAVFSDHLPIYTGFFVALIHSITTILLEFATAVANAKPKAKRLFKFIDIYETIRDFSAAIDKLYSGEVNLDEFDNLKSEISAAGDVIGETVVNMFDDLKNSIRNDANKTPIPGGGVYPLTRHVMNTIKRAFDEYQNTLERIFQHVKPENDEENSSLLKQFLSVIELLEENIETKSVLYKETSLRSIFLMNNFRYILQTVKGTTEMKRMVGDNWCRRKSSDVRNYHKNYQRDSWNQLLQCLKQEGVQVNGKPNRRILKQRFKRFNVMFDEIHKTQNTWVVSDEQLLTEIRVSITAVVSPAYRSFVGRYKPQFEGGKSLDKYIKYQPEDIETLIETLFEGTEKAETQMNGIQSVSTVKQTTGAFKSLLKTYKGL